jgi:ribosomal protein S3
MGQKANPISLRIQQTNRSFDSSWYSDKFYSELILKDLKIKNYLNSFLNIVKRPNARFIIQNSQKKTKIFLFFFNPTLSRTTRSKFFRLQLQKKRKTYQINDPFLKNLPTINKKNLEVGNAYFGLAKRTHSVLQKGASLCVSSKMISEAKELSLIYKINPINFLFSKNEKLTHDIIENRKKNSFLNSEDFYLLGTNKVNEADTLKRGLKTLMLGSFFKHIETSTVKNNYKKLQFLETKINTDIENLSNRFYLRYFLLLYFYFKDNYKTINFHRLIHIFFRFMLLQEKRRAFLTNRYLMHQRLLFAKQRGITNNTYFESRCSPYADIINETSKQKNSFVNNICLPLSATESSLAPLGQKARQIYSKIHSKKELPFSLVKNFKSVNYLENFLSKQIKTNVELIPITVFGDWQSALYFVNEIIYFLERRVKFRAIKNVIFREIANNNHIKGIRISCSGRTGGKSKKAQRSKTESVKYGETSLHVFSSKIDFAFKSAETPYGLVGIKVWICYR